MRAAMLRAGRRPTLQTQKVQKFRSFWSFKRFLACSTSLMPLENENHFFKLLFTTSYSSQKWQSLWLVGENLDMSWWGALLWRRMLESVWEYHSLELGTIPHCRLNRFVKIGESATSCDETRPTCCRSFLFTYHGMKLISTLSLSSLL